MFSFSKSSKVKKKAGEVMKRFTKQGNSWMFYDWGSSAFSVIITTAIFPIYYKPMQGSQELILPHIPGIPLRSLPLS